MIKTKDPRLKVLLHPDVLRAFAGDIMLTLQNLKAKAEAQLSEKPLVEKLTVRS